jgi:hypothetical protein
LSLIFTQVVEESALIARHTVDANVNVTVKQIPEEAVDKSGSIRLMNITAEQFVEPLPGQVSHFIHIMVCPYY